MNNIFGKLFNEKTGKTINKTALVLAVVIAILYYLGVCARAEIIYDGNIYNNVPGFMVGVVFMVITAIILTAVLSLMFAGVDNINQTNNQINSKKTDEETTTNTKKEIGRYMLIFLFAWLPYMLIRFPGNYDHDTITQLVQGYGYAPISDHHPYFDTKLFYAFWRLGDLFGNNSVSLFTYAVFQAICTAYCGASTISYFKQKGIDSRVRKALVVFFAGYPIIPLFTQTMMKDSLFGWVFLLFSLYYVKIIYSRAEVLKDKKELIVFILITLLSMLTKKTGMYVVILCMLATLIYLKKNRIRVLIAYMIPLILFIGLYNNVLLPALGVTKGGQQELFSVPSQQVGAIVKYHSSDLSEDDWNILSSVYYDPQGMGEAYNPLLADAMKGRWINHAETRSKAAFFKWYLKQYFRFPKQMILSVFALDYSIVSVDSAENGTQSMMYFWDNVTSNDHPELGLENVAPYTGSTVEQVHEMIYTTYKTPVIGKLSNAFKNCYLQICDSFAVLFSKVLFASWIPLFVLFYLLYKKNWAGMICMMPVVLTTLMLIVGPTILPRYMVTSVYLTLICIGILFTPIKNRENHEENSKEISKENSK